jgi:hypothetical protein
VSTFLGKIQSFVLSPLGNNAQAQDFEVTDLYLNWESKDFITLPFTSAAISFDSEHNLYASDLFNDWATGIFNIFRLEQPDYGSRSIFLSYETIYQGINGMDFDGKGNLFVSEFMGENSDSDFGAIRKIYAYTNQISEPIEFIETPNAGDFRPTGIAVTGIGTIYFPGRKYSAPDWGNIYEIDSFEKYDPMAGPAVFREGLVATAIEVDKSGNLYIGSRWPDNSIYTVNPYTREIVKIASFNEYVEELTFDSNGNLYALEGVGEVGDLSTIIKLVPPYITIDGCDTGIIDWPLPGGYKISEMIENCEDMAIDHGQFVSCVVDDIIDLMHDGLMSGYQMSAIVSCAAQASIP